LPLPNCAKKIATAIWKRNICRNAKKLMHAAILLLEFWTLAFVSLAITIVLLKIFWELMEQDLYLKTLGWEIIIAAVASLIEAASLWLVITFFHGTPSGLIAKILFVPAFVVALIYKACHFEDWSRYELICLLIFQLAVVLIGASLLTAHFGMALAVLLIFAIALAITVAFMQGM
jgi:hypothetical protein